MSDDHVPTLMTVHAHPDDETIGTGGTMAKASRRAARGRS
jgi:LmbE family N-acetylglucosaminyl deacetylase